MPGAAATSSRSPASLLSRMRSGFFASRSRLSGDSASACAPKWATSAARHAMPRLGVAQRVQLEHNLVDDTQLAEQLRAHRDQFDVGRRLGRADDLGVELVELAITALLRALVAEQRAVGGELHRRELLPAVRDISAADAGGELGAQRQRFAAAVVERVHLLRHDVGRLAERAGEDAGELEHRHVDAAEAVQLAHAVERLDHRIEARDVVAIEVLRAPDPLHFVCHARGDRGSDARGLAERLKADDTADQPGQQREARPVGGLVIDRDAEYRRPRRADAGPDRIGRTERDRPRGIGERAPC